MLVLFETPAGYSLFQINNKKKLQKVENIIEMFNDTNTLSENIQLEAFRKFKDTEHAVNSLTKLNEGELPSDLKKFLQNNIVSKNLQETLLCIYYLFNFLNILILFRLLSKNCYLY